MKQTQPMTVSYVRFSSVVQGQGDSFRRQTALADKWCQDHHTTLTDRIEDLGVSAFKGDNTRAGLSVFLKLIEDGTVPTGSILLVESLDRLSRQKPEVSLQLFLSIINSGVTVITLMDQCRFEPGNLNMGQLMLSVMALCLAHEESVKKSARSKANWSSKRRSGRPMTSTLPSWLKLEAGKIVFREPKATIVREIVALALAGLGRTLICQRLNATLDTPLNPQHVSNILRSRSLIGECQPQVVNHIGGKRVRTPIGEPIADYFPRLISDDQFHAVQNAIAGRRHTGGPVTKWVNLFTSILKDVDGSAMYVTRSGAKSCNRCYVSSAAAQGSKGASPYVTFPVLCLERAIVMTVCNSLHQTQTPVIIDEQVRVDSLTAQLEALDFKVSEVQALIDSTSTASIFSMLSKMDERRKALIAQLNTAKGELAAKTVSPLNRDMESMEQFIEYCVDGTVTLTDDQRLTIKAAVSRLVSKITCKFTKFDKGSSAHVHIDLATGQGHSFDLAQTKSKFTMSNEQFHPSGTERLAGTFLPPSLAA